jgi:hypothetical protein
MQIKNIFLFLTLLLCSVFAHAAVSNPSNPSKDSCDVVAFKNGRIMNAKVLSISKTEIKFRDCGNPKAAETTHNIDDVLSILYSNGSTADFSDKTSSTASTNKPQVNKIESGAVRSKKSSGAATLGILAIILAVIGIWFAAIPLGISAIILGIIGVTKARNAEDNGAQTPGFIGAILGVIITFFGFIALSKRI